EGGVGGAHDADPATEADGARVAPEKPDAGPAHAHGDGDADHDERLDGQPVRAGHPDSDPPEHAEPGPVEAPEGRRADEEGRAKEARGHEVGSAVGTPPAGARAAARGGGAAGA